MCWYGNKICNTGNYTKWSRESKDWVDRVRMKLILSSSRSSSGLAYHHPIRQYTKLHNTTLYRHTVSFTAICPLLSTTLMSSSPPSSAHPSYPSPSHSFFCPSLHIPAHPHHGRGHCHISGAPDAVVVK